MSRKAVTWIAVGALAAAAVIVAAAVACHIGADHGSGRIHGAPTPPASGQGAPPPGQLAGTEQSPPPAPPVTPT